MFNALVGEKLFNGGICELGSIFTSNSSNRKLSQDFNAFDEVNELGSSSGFSLMKKIHVNLV